MEEKQNHWIPEKASPGGKELKVSVCEEDEFLHDEL